MNALILIDIQNDFIPGGSLAVPRGDEIVPIANRLQSTFDLVVATQDWHPRNHGSFAANHPGTRPGQVIDLNGLPQVLWPVHCVQNTPGADFAPALDRSRIIRIFQKGTDPSIDSYSAFYDNAHRRSTGLGDWLREHGATNLYLCGLATDYCVKFSVLDAIELKFKVTLIEDACRGIDLKPGDIDTALKDMTQAGAAFTTSTQLLADRATRP